jgi:hypothetical protein
MFWLQLCFGVVALLVATMFWLAAGVLMAA